MYLYIIGATIVQFIFGAVWYSALFGKAWMRIMEVEQVSKEELSKMQKDMMPFYFLQLFLTGFTTFAFANLLPVVPGMTPYHLAFWLWIGFVAPATVTTVLWGRTKKQFWLQQITIMLSAQIIGMMLMAYIVSLGL